MLMNGNYRASYTGNGVTTVFTVPFYFVASDHLSVSVDGESKVLNSDYTVSGAEVQAGGSITFSTAPANDAVVVVVRSVPYEQLTRYAENDPFPAATHERALDLLTMQNQQQQEILDRSPYLPVSVNSEAPLPLPVGDAVLGWAGDYASGRWCWLSAASVEVSAALANTSDPAKGDALVGFKQPYTGGAARTVHDKFKESLSVRDFGGVLDGTTDDANALEYACAAAYSAGLKSVTIPGSAIKLGRDVDCKGVELVGNNTIRSGTGYPINAGNLRGFVQKSVYDSTYQYLYPPPVVTKNNPMLVKYTSSTSMSVVVKKSSGYVRMDLVYNSFTAYQSEGTVSQVWRVTNVQDISGSAYVMYRSGFTKNGTFNGDYSYSLGPSSADILFAYTQTNGAYTSQVLSGPLISLGFLSVAAADACSSIQVKIDGTLVEDFSNTDSAGGTVFIKQYRTTPGTHTVTVTHNGTTGKKVYVAGGNFFELKDAIPGLSYDNFCYGKDGASTSGNYPHYIYDPGAQEYALFNYTSQTYAGSFHGGETAVATAEFWEDGASVTPSFTGTFKVVRNFQIRQYTKVAWAAASGQDLYCRSVRDFHDKGYTCNYTLEGNGTTLLQNAWTSMTTTSDLWTRVVFPALVDANTGDSRQEGDRIYLGKVNRVLQVNPTNGRTVETYFSPDPHHWVQSGGINVWLVPGQYNKVYYPLVENGKLQVKTISQTLIKLFD